jgi:ATP-binding cassette subfamily F protein 3
MTLLSATNIKKSFGADELFTDVNFRLTWRDKLALVGRNGAGKTTLLHILTGQMDSDGGRIQLAPGVRIGVLRQHQIVSTERTVLEEAEAAFAEVARMEARLHELARRMQGADHSLPELLEEYGTLTDRFDAMGGFDVLRDVPSVLSRLGFKEADFEKSCASLSGGEQTRLGLAKLLLSGPDVLLLDEPTNHLDINATEWLEGFLRDFGGGLVVVSHDRVFLDRVATDVGELANGRLTIYSGNYTHYRQQKEERERRQLETFEREQREIAHLTEFFEKWKNTPSKRSQAVMRQRWAERIKATASERPTSAGKTANLNFKASGRSAGVVVRAEGLAMRYGERTLFENLGFEIMRGDRVGVVGPNGAGKSTLIRLLLGREEPVDGSIVLGGGVSVGYFAQETGDLDDDGTVLENMMDVADLTPQQARTHLGSFLFTGDDVFRPVRLLSGGERNKLVLAQLVYMQPNLLILDEPTNHLDIESREALTGTLAKYDGTLICVSHDRYLLEQVTTHTLVVSDGNASFNEGTYSQVRAREAQASSAPKPRAVGVKRGARAAGDVAAPVTQMNARQRSKARQKAVDAVAKTEDLLATLEDRLATVEGLLSNAPPDVDLVELAAEHTKLNEDIAEQMDLWSEQSELAESLNDNRQLVRD